MCAHAHHAILAWMMMMMSMHHQAAQRESRRAIHKCKNNPSLQDLHKANPCAGKFAAACWNRSTQAKTVYAQNHHHKPRTLASPWPCASRARTPCSASDVTHSRKRKPCSRQHTSANKSALASCRAPCCCEQTREQAHRVTTTQQSSASPAIAQQQPHNREPDTCNNAIET